MNTQLGILSTRGNIQFYVLVGKCRGLGVGLLGQHQRNRWKHTQKKHIPETPEGQSQRLLPGVQKFKTQETEKPALGAPFRKTFLKPFNKQIKAKEVSSQS